MQLTTVFDILNTVHNAGLTGVILEKRDSSVFIRGADDDISVVVLSEMDGNIVDFTTGIHKVSTLLDRMKLFDLSKAKVAVTSSEDYTKTIKISQGHKNVSFTCANPKHISVPSGNVTESILNHVTLNKKATMELCQAVSALSPEYISMSGQDDDIFIKLFDGVADSFVDIVGTNQSGDWSNHWNATKFVKLLRLAIKTDDEVVIGIGEFGKLYIEIEGITFMLRPQAV